MYWQGLAPDLPGEPQSLSGRKPEASGFGIEGNMDVKKTLNSLLVTAFQDVLDIEEKTLITGEFTDITMNDMHVIEAIGDGEPKTSSTVAKQLSVTMGTLTKAIDRLTKNNYVLRERSETDKRLVLLSLKEKGKKAFVPQSGYILKDARVPFEEGESAFDAL